MNIKIVLGIATLFVVIESCQNGNKISEKMQSENASNNIKTELIQIVKPYNGSVYKFGDVISFEVQKSPSETIDSIVVYKNKKRLETIDATGKYKWNSTTGKLGQNEIEFESFSKSGKKDIKSLIVKLNSNIKPQKLSYKINKIYPHSRNSYTQGLIYENGFFYESSGEYGKSALRKVKLETGETINLDNLENNYFGEGLALYKNKLYQVTWREHTAFVYDKQTFKLERKFNYDITEGWGLECDGTNFLMTDGSNIIYFLDPTYFSEVGRIEVMDDKGEVDNLNELELIDGKLFANVYMTDRVVMIDPKTGIVESEIDFSGLLPKADYTETTNVLNGIAYNKSSKHLYITGKNWPKLFEIELVKNR